MPPRKDRLCEWHERLRTSSTLPSLRELLTSHKASTFFSNWVRASYSGRLLICNMVFAVSCSFRLSSATATIFRMLQQKLESVISFGLSGYLLTVESRQAAGWKDTACPWNMQKCVLCEHLLIFLYAVFSAGLKLVSYLILF